MTSDWEIKLIKWRLEDAFSNSVKKQTFISGAEEFSWFLLMVWELEPQTNPLT